MTAPSPTPKLAKATLYKLVETKQPNAAKPTPPTVDLKSATPVQFNPTTLKISYTNEASGGDTTKGQAKQSPVEGHSTLTFDLEFDTAEGDNGQPVDVRTKTAKVLDFVRPAKDNPANPPPRVQFVWGALIFNGIVNSINEEIDYFDAEGRALRSKLSVSIKEQNLDLEVNKSGPASRNADAASKPGEPARAGGPGSSPTKNPLLTIAAQAGESVQQALSRINALPDQWRSAMSGLQSPLNLAAGTPIQLGADVTATAGANSTAFGADQLPPSDVSLSGTVDASSEVSAGFGLAAAGGIGASADSVAAAQSSAEVSAARGAFATPSTPAAYRPSVGSYADRRLGTYGRTIPLQARPHAVTAVGASLGGPSAVSARAKSGEVPTASSPATPPWQALPKPPSGGRRSGDACGHTMT
jgi:Contractile injection system tube protein